jgi:hypothetical protein
VALPFTQKFSLAERHGHLSRTPQSPRSHALQTATINGAAHEYLCLSGEYFALTFTTHNALVLLGSACRLYNPQFATREQSKPYARSSLAMQRAAAEGNVPSADRYWYISQCAHSSQRALPIDHEGARTGTHRLMFVCASAVRLSCDTRKNPPALTSNGGLHGCSTAPNWRHHPAPPVIPPSSCE